MLKIGDKVKFKKPPRESLEKMVLTVTAYHHDERIIVEGEYDDGVPYIMGVKKHEIEIIKSKKLF